MAISDVTARAGRTQQAPAAAGPCGSGPLRRPPTAPYGAFCITRLRRERRRPLDLFGKTHCELLDFRAVLAFDHYSQDGLRARWPQ